MRVSTVLFLFLGLFLFSCKDKKVTIAEKPKGPAEKMTVNGVIAVEISKTENVKTTGTVLASEKVDIKSEISGRLISIHFKEGGYVKKGQLLFKLDDAELQAEKKKLQLQIKLDEIKEKRQKQLLIAKAISEEEYDLTEGNLNILKSNMAILNAKIAKTVMVAPFSGIMGFRNVSQGAIVSQSDILTSLQSIQPLKIEFSVPEKLTKDIKTGQKISFALTSDNNLRQANIYAIDPQIDPLSRSLVLRALYSNPKGDLLPGAFTDINIMEGVKANYIAIPSMAYVPDISGALVYIKKGGKVTPVKVLAASRSESQVFIESGLTVGDTIITSGLLKIKPGIDINVTIQEN